MRRPFGRRAATHLSLLTLVGATLVATAPQAPTPAQAAPVLTAPAPHSNGMQYKVLVFTRSASGDNAATAAGVQAIQQLGRDQRFTVEVTGDARKFDAPHLKQFRVVVFLNTAGNILNDAQRTAFEKYYRDGGGFVGVHSAIEAEPDWSFLTNVLGTRATGAPSAASAATVTVADRVHPASESLPQRWSTTDRWYNFKANVRGVSHVLATVDEKSYSGGTMGFDHPITWCKDYQGGRSFYTGLGATPESYDSRDLRAHLGGAIQWAAGVTDGDCGATVLANYQMTVIGAQPNVNEPIGFDVLPDGRVIQTDRRGGVRLHNPETNQTTVLAQIPVYTHSEDGMYGPAIDNDFATNKWVYLYYAPPLNTPAGSAPTTSTDPRAWDQWQGYFQLSRFKFVDGANPSLDVSTEQKILQVPVDRGACCHVAGDIAFDSKNNLWLVTGDDTPAGGGGSGGFSPHNDSVSASGVYQAPFVDARRSSANTNDLRGKILRITVQADGSYTVPAGNLYPAGTEKTRPEVYAMGFRNPFRITLDKNDVAYITDYSPDSSTAQVGRGPAGTGRMMVVDKPANYGWPMCVQPNLPYIEMNWTTNPISPVAPFDCAAPKNTSRHNTGLVDLLPTKKSELWYSFQAPTPCPESYLSTPTQTCPNLFPELGTGGVGPHGAAKYDYDPELRSETKFPAYYDGAIFFGEFTRDYLKEIRLDDQGEILKINSLLNCGDGPVTPAEPFLCDNPMDMKFGPDGNFYLLTYGDGFFNINPDAAMVKFSYVKGLRAPTAVLAATPTNGRAPLTVQFSSEGSNDPDPGDSISFAWDFDGNGTIDSIDPNPTFTYTQNGVYTARLTVTDSSGKSASANTVITVGNTAPTVRINTPVEGGFFSWGDDIPWSVTVTDPEDGPIDCNKVEVTFVLGHDEHGHGEANQFGCSGVLPTEADDASHGGYIYGVISASYTDKGANGQPPLTTVAQQIVQDKRQQVEFAREQSGTTVGTTTDTGGGQQRGGLDPGDWIAVNNKVNLVNMSSVTFRTSGGSAATAGQPRFAIELRLDRPDGPLLTTATIRATTGNNDFTSTTVPITDPGGSRKLYLVLTTVAGGPASGFGNLNWVDFNGQGIGVTP
ncbi:ThuA domain-containing protein [Micromonospora narathiwatensis]|uniref:PKD repeat n=1 Tax=Micromonospora narathiwatensis TaxID=299146 RepID=A0A1A8ZZF2_9ACTN|nr:ThuA domain-containing protein [Micromonospora narathiwatensis]SBT49317.1 PKD repeat [Micromonospora narathiwatensis]